jgi:hypothetical protein
LTYLIALTCHILDNSTWYFGGFYFFLFIGTPISLSVILFNFNECYICLCQGSLRNLWKIWQIHKMSEEHI